jgi:hypothetical protein
MQMKDGLTCRKAVVDADVESVGRAFLQKLRSRFPQGLSQGCSFFLICRKDRSNMALRHD